MTVSPLVTVYIPTYNRLGLLRRAIDSVLKQDYENIELIVVDDGSIDGTCSFLRELISKDSRVRCFVNEKNSGACVSRNRAISAASGEFVTGLDDDDYFLENRISTFLGAWGKKQDNTVALYSNSCFLKAGGKKRKTKRRIKVVRENLFERNHIGNQIFVRTESIRAIAGFDEALPAWQDYDCWFRILKDPNQQMELTPQVNYVIDISHTYDRIGMTARAKKLDAFNIIVKKLNISGKRLASMRVVMFDSAKISPSFRLIFLKSMLSWSASNVFLAQKVLLKSKINKWPKYSELFNAPENPGI